MDTVKHEVQEDPRTTDPFPQVFSAEEAVAAVKHEVQEEQTMMDPFAEVLTTVIEAPDGEETMADQLEICSEESSSYFCDEQIQVVTEINKIGDIVDMNDATVETYYFEINGEEEELIVTSEKHDGVAEIDFAQKESDVSAVPMVVLEDLAPHLEQSNCFCKDCKILLATPKALDAHNTTAHSLLIARSHRAVKSTAKSSYNAVWKSIVTTDKKSAQKGMSSTDKIHISKRNKAFKSTAKSAVYVARKSTTTDIKKGSTIKDSPQKSQGNAGNLIITKSNLAANPILKQRPKSPTVRKSSRKRKGEVESGTLMKNKNSQPMASRDLAVGGPSSRTFEVEKALLHKTFINTKKIVESLYPLVRKELQQQKELTRMLLPDAPPRKKSRNLSPEREPCKLVPGTPSVPPPPKLQPWQIKKLEHQKKQRAYAKSLNSSLNSVAQPPSSSVVPSPKCDYTSGQLNTDNMSPVVFVLGGESQPTQPAVTDSQPQPSTAAVNPCQSKPKHKTAGVSDDAFEHWTRQTGDLDSDDDDNLDIDIDECEVDGDIFGATDVVDHLNNAPALLPDYLEAEVRQWLTNDDNEGDRHLTDLVSPDYLTFDWSGDVSTFTGRRETFRGTPGPTFPVTKETSPIEIFLKFFDDDLLDLIVTRTNEYSAYAIDHHMKTPNSRLKNWKNTDKGEIAVLIAIIILQGLVQMPVENDYWTENGYLTLKYFRTLMPYNRYVLLKRMLHFSSISPESTTDSTDPKLGKIWPVIKHLQEKFCSLYLPEQDLSLDESLLKWSGRLSFAQKIATKAAKVGVKTYELCESKTGYLWNFFVYTGKTDKETDGQTDGQREGQTDTHTDGQTARPTTSADRSGPPAPTGATAAIVLDLVKPLLNLGHTLVMDNFYNSPLLARYLKIHGTDCFGTLRVNREFVPDSLKNLSKAQLRVGEFVHSYCRDVSVCLYNDHNLVSLLSTYHVGEAGCKEKNGRVKYRPKVVLDYNITMGGVDKKDQLLAAHPMEKKRNMVWYKKVFRRLLNVTVLNSYIIYKTQHPGAAQRSFRIRLANELVRIFRPAELIPTRVQDNNSIDQLDLSGCRRGAVRPWLTGNHFVGKSATRTRQCVWCHKSRSAYLCKQCKVVLCLDICFEEYHTKPPTSNK